jgi:hypothetical protein
MSHKLLWKKKVLENHVCVQAKTYSRCPVHLRIGFTWADESPGGVPVYWSGAWVAELEDLLAIVPPYLERWCPAYLEDVFSALEKLDLGFARPPVLHEELHADAREGYDG